MFYQLLHILRIESVHDVEEILSRRKSALWNFVWEETHELVDLLHMRPKVFDR